MCTSLTMTTGNFYFGRNMDINFCFGEHIVITPRKFPLNFRMTESVSSHFAIIGMAAVIDDYPMYADGANEKGLCMAGLNFPGNALFTRTKDKHRTNIAPFELIPWVLGQCSSAAEAKKLLENTSIIDIPFSEKIPNSPLHWHIADSECSLVLECTHKGMQIYDDPVGVLTNNPPFDFHMQNLAQYLNLTVSRPENVFTDAAGVKPFGHGFGSIGLPGDFSPASRFVRTAFLRLNSVCDPDELSSVSQFFHLLDSSAVIRGSMSDSDYSTVYSCCMNADRGIYYYKTYSNSMITAVDINSRDLGGNALYEFPLRRQLQIHREG